MTAKQSKLKASSKKRRVSHKGAGKKGKQFERECADLLGTVFPDAKRHLESQQAECGGFDLDNTGIFRFQCKRNAAYCNPSKIEEVRTPEGQIPVLLTRGDNKKAVAVLYFEDFVAFLEEHLNFTKAFKQDPVAVDRKKSPRVVEDESGQRVIARANPLTVGDLI